MIVIQDDYRCIREEVERSGQKYKELRVDLWWSIVDMGPNLGTHILHKTCTKKVAVEGWFNPILVDSSKYFCEGCGHSIPPEARFISNLVKM